MRQKGFELLAPAGSFETLRAVIAAGADAVYIGGEQFGARAYAENFSGEELIAAIDHAHLRGVKVYLAVNTLLKNRELEEELADYLWPLYLRGLDAVLVQDFGVLSLIRSEFPDLSVHASTQMTVTGIEGVSFLQRCGVKRVVMAREVSLDEMRWIQETTGAEIEAFVHGALCYSYSGQCLFSGMLGGRSGNRGRCAQPCRLSYEVLDAEQRRIREDSYVLSLKDMCGIERLPDLYRSGVYSLKIEGRMKQAEYAAGVVSVYRGYIDAFLRDTDAPFAIAKRDRQLLSEIGNRCGSTCGYYDKQNGKDMVCFEKPNFSHADNGLYEKIRMQYVKEDPIRIKGRGSFTAGEKAGLTVWTTDGAYEAAVTGKEVETARKAPLTKADIHDRLNKTGNTDFVFSDLEIVCGENIFLPNGALNQLRREALALLRQKMLEGFLRAKPSADPVRKTESIEDPVRKEELSADPVQKEGSAGRKMEADSAEGTFCAEVCTCEQLHEVLGCAEITDIYISSDLLFGRDDREAADICRRVKESGKGVFLSMPHIFRRQSYDLYESKEACLRSLPLDGFLVHSYDSFGWALSHFPDKCIRAGHFLYTMNDRAAEAFFGQGAKRVRMPLELNRSEIAGRDNSGTEMIVYGYYPLMHTAQCIQANTKGCSKRPGILYLRDRYRKHFPVRNVCQNCYNVIYNSLPTNLLSECRELSDMGVHFFVLSFSVESAEESRAVLEQMRAAAEGGKYTAGSQNTYTRGHYKRGVE